MGIESTTVAQAIGIEVNSGLEKVYGFEDFGQVGEVYKKAVKQMKDFSGHLSVGEKGANPLTLDVNQYRNFFDTATQVVEQIELTRNSIAKLNPKRLGLNLAESSVKRSSDRVSRALVVGIASSMSETDSDVSGLLEEYRKAVIDIDDGEEDELLAFATVGSSNSGVRSLSTASYMVADDWTDESIVRRKAVERKIFDKISPVLEKTGLVGDVNKWG